MERQLAPTRKLEAFLQGAAPVRGPALPIRSPIHQVLQLQGAVGLDRVQADAVLDFQQVVGNRGTGAILARQPKGKHTEKPIEPGKDLVLRSRVHKLVESADRGWGNLGDFVQLADSELSAIEFFFSEYLDRYGAAYDRFAKVLKQAQSDAARREAIASAALGILVGTGVGLAAGALFEATTMLGKVLVELGSEFVEAGAAQIYQQEPPAFEPPEKLDPDKIAIQGWKDMMKAWQALARLSPTIIGFGSYLGHVKRLDGELEGAASGRAPRSSADYYAQVEKLEQRDEAKHVSRLLWSARVALDTFVIAARSPRIFRHSEEIERDIWISWIAGLHGGGKSPDNPEAWSMEDMIKVHSALDEDAVEDHLHRIGVLGEGSRLGVSFGDFTSGSDTLGAYKEARKEERRMNLLGRIVVAINAIDPSLPTGVVRVRHDAYSLTGRPDPDPAAAEDYFRAISADGPIEGGELCEVTDTSTQMVVVKRPRGARGRTSVTAAESTKAGKIAGRRGAQ